MHIFVNILIIAAVLVILVFLIGYFLIQLSMVRNHEQDIDRTDPSYVEKNENYKEYHEKVLEGVNYFRSQNHEVVDIKSFDGLKLMGYLWEPEVPTTNTIICVHGYRADALYDFGVKMKYLMNLGWNLLLVDDRAHGRSEGHYVGFGNLDALDVLSWCKYINNRYGENSRIILHGVSMGGATVLAAAGLSSKEDNVKGVIEDCGFSSGYDVVRTQLKAMYHLPEWPFLPVANFWLKCLAKFDLKQRAARELIKDFKGELLVIHGKTDDFVPTYMSGEIYDSAVCSKDILLVDDAGHVLSYLYDQKGYEEKFGQLIDRVLQQV